MYLYSGSGDSKLISSKHEYFALSVIMTLFRIIFVVVNRITVIKSGGKQRKEHNKRLRI